MTHVNTSKAVKNSLIAVVMKYAGREKEALLPVLTDSEQREQQHSVSFGNGIFFKLNI